jgi:hypothetical protein
MPRWLQDAKFGIYTHWGSYSDPAKVASRIAVSFKINTRIEL